MTEPLVINDLLGNPTNTQDDSFAAADTSIIRNGNVNLIVKSGNVLGGVGGSAAVSVGNIEATVDANILIGTMTANGTINLDGKTTTTINGDINTIVAGEIDTAGVTEGGTANIGAFANGVRQLLSVARLTALSMATAI